MTLIPTVEQLRKDIESSSTDLARIEGQQESAQEELAKLQAEAEELGIKPDNLSAESRRILDDVNTAVEAVREEIQSLSRKTSDE
jgi:uncharacterized protein (DUF3084 family)